jgi:hypothetical protein
MALMKCNECGEPVFTLAVACPRCGAPVTAQTVEQMGKSWKEVKFLSIPRFLGVLLILFGIVGGCALVLYLWVRLGPWWHHGD